MRILSATLVLLLLLVGCRNPDVRDETFIEPPDTAVVDEPLYDPTQVDPFDQPGAAQDAAEIQARRTILQDPLVREAQVAFVDDTVRVTAVLADEGVGDARIKGEQFVTEAFRQIERPGTTPGAQPLGPSRYAYWVSIRDLQGNVVFEGIKGPGEREIREDNLNLETPAGS